MIKVGIGIPTPERVHPDFAITSLTEIISYTKKNLPDIDLSLMPTGGVRTDRNRNAILQHFIDAEMDYVLWLDADMVYPADILERYFELEKLHGEMSVIGCLYFKRTPDYTPIGYVDSGNEKKPFRPLMPQLIKRGIIYEVKGLGYGGMLVPMSVYDSLGEKKWTRYGENFYNPQAETGNLTHDLVFCKDVDEAGHKIFLHGSVRPGHIGELLVTEETFFDHFPPKLLPGLRVVVAMPTIDMDLGVKAAEVMKQRAGYACTIRVIEDKNRTGFIQTINNSFKNEKCDMFVYTAQDAFVGNNWLANALIQQFKTQAGLTAFNDGKWDGKLASFGMVDKRWASQNYDGDLFHPEYHSHYADTELTQVAKQQGGYTYAENAVMLEVDYQKAIGNSKGVVKADKKLYKKRKKDGFGGLVTSEDILEQFS